MKFNIYRTTNCIGSSCVENGAASASIIIDTKLPLEKDGKQMEVA
jgi:hypothetical protein